MGIKIKNWFLKFQLKKIHLLLKHCSFSFRKAFASFWTEKKISCILRHSESVKWSFFGWKVPDLGHFQGFSSFSWVKILLKWPKSGTFQPKTPHLTDSECRRMHEIFFSVQNEVKALLNEKEQCLGSKRTFFSWNFKNKFLILMPILASCKIA